MLTMWNSLSCLISCIIVYTIIIAFFWGVCLRYYVWRKQQELLPGLWSILFVTNKICQIAFNNNTIIIIITIWWRRPLSANWRIQSILNWRHWLAIFTRSSPIFTLSLTTLPFPCLLSVLVTHNWISQISVIIEELLHYKPQKRKMVWWLRIKEVVNSHFCFFSYQVSLKRTITAF